MPATALDASIGLIELVPARELVSRLSGVNRRGLPFYPDRSVGRPRSLIDIPGGDNRKNKKSIPIPIPRVTFPPISSDRNKIRRVMSQFIIK